MKQIFTKITRLMLVFMMLAFGLVSNAQQLPTYKMYVTNELQTSPTVYQFDVYLLNTSATTFELANVQFGLFIDPIIKDGGTITPSYLVGSTQLNTAQTPTTVSFTNTVNYFNLAAKPNPGFGLGSIISSTNGGCSSPGTRVGTFIVTNSVPFKANSQSNSIFSTSAGSGRTNTIVSAYDQAAPNSPVNINSAANNLGYNVAGTCLTNLILNPTICNGAGTTTPVSCFGGNNGSATITITGSSATSTGTYTLDGGGSLAYASNPFTINNLTAGSHTIVVTNATSTCTTAPIQVSVTQPSAALSASVSAQTDVLCHGSSTGSATISATGGTPNYTYSWSPSGGVAATASNLAAGDYTVTVTDANGCSTPVLVTITEPATSVSGSITSQTNVSCFGGSNGSATVSGSGGTSAYTYSWSPSGGTAATATGLSAGSYTVTVTDANGCSTPVIVDITQPTQLVANESHTQAACGGFSSVTITGTGGTAPYTGEGTFSLAAGTTHTYTITDFNGCTASVTVTATVPGGPSANITASTNVSCFGGSNGSATVTATGGAGNYTYSWSPSGGTAATATGLAAGDYTVTVTDANNCTTTATVTISQPTAALAAAETHTVVSCFGGTSTVSITATGGTAPYTGTGNFTQSAGTQSYTVTDANGCSTSVSATVSQPTQVVAAESHTAVSCFGGTSTVTISATGGTGAYTGTGNFTQSAGTQSYTVTDANGCTASVSVTVSQPTQLVAAESHTAIVCGGTSTVTISATGGTAPYTGTGDFSQTAGTQSYNVTDANGCTSSVSVTVTAPNGPTAAQTHTNVLCFGGSTGTATITATGGLAPYTGTGTFSGLVAGVYNYTVTDANNCSSSVSVTITEPSAALAAAESHTVVSCFGGTSTVTISATGGTAPYTGTGTFTQSAGTQSYTVTDFNGCTTSVSATVTEPTQVVASETHTAVSCFGGTSTVTISATGGTGSYTGTGTFTQAAGTQSYNVTDANGCTSSISVTVTQPTQVVATESHTAIACFGGTSTVTISATGGTGAYTGTGTFTQSVGSHTYTVTDANGCTATVTATITQPALVTAPTISLINNGNGTYNITANGLFAGATVLWNTSATTNTITVAPGTYTVTQTYLGCTSAAGSITISGNITADPAVGGLYFTDLADVQVINANTDLLFGQTYKIKVPVFNGNQENNIPSGSTKLVIDLGTRVALDASFPGSATLGAYFSWTSATVAGHLIITGDQIADIPADFADIAEFRITGTLSCTSNVLANFNVTNHNTSYVLVDEITSNNFASIQYTLPVNITATAVNVTCNGAINGSITVVASAGTTIIIRNASNQVVTAPFGPGTYSVTASALGDNPPGNICSKSVSVTITQPAVLTAVTSGTNVSCFGSATGTATVVAGGGTAPYTYSWNTLPVQTTTTATGLAAGTYIVTVTDANGCTKTASYTVTQPTQLTATVTGTNVNCFGNATGTATVVAAGGTAPYSYSWNTTPVQTTATATGLTVGTYTVTVTDFNGCTTTAAYSVTQPGSALSASAFGTNVSCFGNASGTATAVATGGTAPYTYSWNTTPVQTGAVATGLVAGTYTVTVTGVGGCTATASYTVTQPTAALAAATSGTNVSCFGGINGTATVVATGGTAPYSYSWNSTPVQTTATASGLIAATYTVTVTDALGCSTTSTFTVSQPTALTATASGTNISCFGGNNGTATVVAGGGTAPYTYSWNTTPIQTTATASVLVAGIYTVTVTDANGCTKTASYTVTQPTVLTAEIGSVTNVSCNGGTNGTATVIAVGGTAPYTYSWNTTPVQTTATATGLGVGTYTATVTDAHGCTSTNTFSVTEPTILVATASGTNVGCFGNASGTATASVSGGTAPYSYSWNSSPVQTTATASGLVAGTYTVTVTDFNGCIKTATYTVTQPAAALAATATGTNVSCFGNATGTATVVATGGTAPYTYSWNTTPVQTNATATGLAAGTYTVTVTDANGCSTTASYSVTQPVVGLAVTASGTNVTCFGNANGTATALVTGGSAPYTYTWNSTPVQTTATATNLAPGTYTVTVSDLGGCSAVTASYTVTQPTAALTINITNVTNNSCHGGNTGSISAAAAGGTTAYVYSITGPTVNTTGASSGVFTSLAAGFYTITVTDANGCSNSISTSVSQPAGTDPDITLGSDYTGNFFPTDGVAQTIVYNVAEVGGNPSVGDTIRITKIAGYNISFNTSLTSYAIGTTTYTLDNPNWKIDNSNPAFVSIILKDPLITNGPGTVNCSSLVNVAITLTRNSPNIQVFTLTARLRKSNGEVKISNNLNPIVFSAE